MECTACSGIGSYIAGDWTVATDRKKCELCNGTGELPTKGTAGEALERGRRAERHRLQWPAALGLRRLTLAQQRRSPRRSRMIGSGKEAVPKGGVNAETAGSRKMA